MDRVRQTLQKRGTLISYLTLRYLIHEDHCFKHCIVDTVSEICLFYQYNKENSNYFTDVETDVEGNIYVSEL